MHTDKPVSRPTKYSSGDHGFQPTKAKEGEHVRMQHWPRHIGNILWHVVFACVAKLIQLAARSSKATIVRRGGGNQQARNSTNHCCASFNSICIVFVFAAPQMPCSNGIVVAALCPAACVCGRG